MSNKFLKITVLAVAFLVPTSWYLFLQFFGENKFELQVINQLEDSCLIEENAFYLNKSQITPLEENEVKRLKSFTDSENIKLILNSGCLSEKEFSLLLVDRKKQLRGEYDLSILEIDRALIEAELLLKLQKDGDE